MQKEGGFDNKCSILSFHDVERGKIEQGGKGEDALPLQETLLY